MKAAIKSGSSHSASIGWGQPCAIVSTAMPVSANTRSKSARHAADARAPALYMRVEVTNKA